MHFGLPHSSLFSGSTPFSPEHPQGLEKLESLGVKKIAKKKKKEKSAEVLAGLNALFRYALMFADKELC